MAVSVTGKGFLLYLASQGKHLSKRLMQSDFGKTMPAMYCADQSAEREQGDLWSRASQRVLQEGSVGKVSEAGRTR